MSSLFLTDEALTMLQDSSRHPLGIRIVESDA